ncbi:MAG TPA: bifunctional 5,10-methylenetetrahydrofolate dehydrogenase/5,10-methenyltetrahydrofolate cyclohydrolase [Thermoplasmatales archaeon]|nr:bifunctional 5,10-methylenetetrahydrofolate dehydrogenase/5,10-methenyltetrahydrofolate cyclohydrolase [Thermoplasmatales archaeon]
MALIVDGRRIANRIKERVSLDLKKLASEYGIAPAMATIMIGNNEESELYFKLREKASKEVGIKSKLYRFPDDATEREIIDTILDLNKDEEIHGIMVQRPVPNHLSLFNILSKIDPDKDVEGMAPQNLGNLFLGRETIVPCTPLAILKILDHTGVKLEGANAVIINHSPIIGKPLAILLLNRNATVSVCHVFTRDLLKYTREADILVTATGTPNLIGREHVKNGSIIIDAGISKTEKGICGDVDFDGVKDKAGIITPVPGGVGPVTIACVFENLLKLYKKRVQGG